MIIWRKTFRVSVKSKKQIKVSLQILTHHYNTRQTIFRGSWKQLLVKVGKLGCWTPLRNKFTTFFSFLRNVKIAKLFGCSYLHDWHSDAIDPPSPSPPPKKKEKNSMETSTNKKWRLINIVGFRRRWWHVDRLGKIN